MTISRSQMNRELYGLGSYFPPENGREKYGLGSKFKKFVRKVIPNEVSKIAVKAAPFVAPFNPLLAAGMAGIGGFDQTGKIGSSLKSGLLTYGGGQAARYLGGAGFQKGYNPFGGLGEGAYSLGGFQLGASPIGTDTGIGKMFAKTPTQEITTVSGGDFGQFTEPTFGAGDALGGEMLTTKPLEQATSQAVTKATNTVSPKYSDLFGKVLKGDLQQKTQALKDLGGKALKDIYTNPVRDASGKIIDNQVDKLAVGATIAGATSYYEAAKLAKEAGLVEDEDAYTEEMYNADKSRYTDYYSKILTPEAFGLKEGGIVSIRKNKAMGGMGEEEILETSSKSAGIPSITLEKADEENNLVAEGPGYWETVSDAFEKAGGQEGTGMSLFDFADQYFPKMADGGRIGLAGGGGYADDVYDDDYTAFSLLRDELMQLEGDDYYTATRRAKKAIYGMKDGGRIGYAMGSEVPVRRNQGGITELDYRNTGGFVPIGVKEKADDVPAMLSKNEFVFTADAVRAAGGGNINKGAQKMYQQMKALENKVV